jgi:hypothetical protein
MALLVPQLALAAPALDATACPTGVPLVTWIDFQASDGPVSPAISTAGAVALFAIGYISSSGASQTLTAPATMDWSDSSGNTVSAPSGASAWTLVARSSWPAPYANTGDIALYKATASSALTSARVKLVGATAHGPTGNTRKGGIVVFPYVSDNGGTISVGATANTVDLQDPPSATVALRTTITAQAAGSQIVVMAWNDDVNTALSGDTGRASQAGYTSTHGTKIDVHHETSTSDAIMVGRLATSSSGTIAVTTGAGAVTVGATASDNYIDVLAFEVKDTPPGDVTATLSGVNGSGTVATLTVTGDANVSATGVSGTGTVGSLSINGDASVTPSGVSGSGAVGSMSAFVSPWTFPLSVSSNSRYLVDVNGKPFRIQGDAMWDAPFNLTLADLRTYLDDRQAKGFNAMLTYVSTPAAYFVGSNAPWALQLGGSAAGVSALPFLKNISGGTWDGDPTFANFDADFSQPNDAFFAWMAQVADEAAMRGMVLLLFPAYLGFNNGANDGWYQTLTNAGNTTTVCSNFGQYLANGHGVFTGFKDRPNIIWVAGGDMLPTNGSAGALRMKAILTGLQAAGDTHLITAHWRSDYLTRDQTDMASLINVQASYTHGNYPTAGPTYAEGRALYSATPTLPTFLIETNYWGDYGATPAQHRYFQWGAALSNVGGTTFGFTPFWGFAVSPDGSTAVGNTTPTSWQASFSYATTNKPKGPNTYVSASGNWYRLTANPGTSGSTKPSGTTTFNDNGITWTYVAAATSVLTLLNETPELDMQRLGTFLDSVSWQNLVPSGLGGNSTLITAGGGTAASWSDGTFASGGMDWVVSSSTPDGTLLVAYVPDAHSGSVTIDMSVMSGSTRARWFDPTDGTYTAISTGLSNSGTHAFTVPGTNTGGAADWLLVLDSTDANVTLSGVSGSGAVGSMSVTGDANVSPTGVSGDGTVGTMTVSGDASVALSGVSGDGAVGSVEAAADAVATLLGVSGDGTVGSLTATGDALISLTPATGDGVVGDLGVTTDGNTTFSLGGVSGDGVVGSVSVSADALVALGSVSGDGTVGSMTVSGDGVVAITGVSGDGVVGTLDVSTGGTDVVVTITGVSADGAVGSLSITGDALVALTGVSGDGVVGTVTGSGAPPAVVLTVTVPLDPFPLELPADEPFVRSFTWTFPVGDAAPARLTLTSDGVAADLAGYSAEIRATIAGALVTEPGESEAGGKSMSVTMLPDLTAAGSWKAAAVLTSPMGVVTTRTGTLVIRDRGQYWNLTVATGTTPIARAVVTLAGKRQSLGGAACELVATRGGVTFHRSGVLAENDTACLVEMLAADTATAGTWDAALIITHPAWPGPRSSLGRLVIRSHP